MATEGKRSTARKKVLLPSGEVVEVPVITQISFIDPYERYQEWEYSIDNSDESGRSVRVDELFASEEGEIVSDDSISVERITKWPHTDVYDRGQETQVEIDNETGKDDIPPHFSTHLQTHTVKYKQRDDDGNLSEDVWIESELIDAFTFVDPYDRYQEKTFSLLNPQNDDDAQINPDDPDITIGDGSGEGTEETPARLDPFQNIVNFSDVPPIFTLTMLPVPLVPVVTDGAPPFDTGTPLTSPPPHGQIPAGTNAVFGWLSSVPITSVTTSGVQNFPSKPDVFGDGPDISHSPSPTFSAWLWITCPQKPPSAVPIVSGPPLVIDGRTIPGARATLTATYTYYAAPILGATGPYDTPGGGGPVGHWWAQEGGYAARDPITSNNSPQEVVASIVITVSPAPFAFHTGGGLNYKAVGLYDAVNSTGVNTIRIHCVPV